MPKDRFYIKDDNLKIAADMFKRIGRVVPDSALREAGERIGVRLVRMMKRPTATWNTPVNLEHEVIVLPRRGVRIEFDADQIYGWVTMGTRRHRIPGPIAYSFPSVPKTIPGTLSAGPGAIGTEIVFIPKGGFMDHPGIEPREFHVLAAKQAETWAKLVLAEELMKALDNIVRSTRFIRF